LSAAWPAQVPSARRTGKPFEHGLFLGKTALNEAALVPAEIGGQLLAVAGDVPPERGQQGRLLPG